MKHSTYCGGLDRLMTFRLSLIRRLYLLQLETGDGDVAPSAIRIGTAAVRFGDNAGAAGVADEVRHRLHWRDAQALADVLLDFLVKGPPEWTDERVLQALSIVGLMQDAIRGLKDVDLTEAIEVAARLRQALEPAPSEIGNLLRGTDEELFTALDSTEAHRAALEELSHASLGPLRDALNGKRLFVVGGRRPDWWEELTVDLALDRSSSWREVEPGQRPSMDWLKHKVGGGRVDLLVVVTDYIAHATSAISEYAEQRKLPVAKARAGRYSVSDRPTPRYDSALMGTSWEIEPDLSIARSEIHDRYGGNRQRGIAPCTTSPNILIFSAATSGHQHGYMDHWDDDGVFHYYGEGQVGDQEFTMGNSAILNHRRDGRVLRVFDGARGAVTYLGAFELDAHPFYRASAKATSGPDRSAIVFRLRRLTGGPDAPPYQPRQTLALASEQRIGDRITDQTLRWAFGEDPAMNADPIPAVRHEQKGVTCYVGHMPAWMSRQVTFADSFPPDESNGRIGYQRQPNLKRAKAFADYLAHSDSGFMTPILLNSRTPIDFRSQNGSGIGEIHVASGQQFAKIDGQHRGLGIESYLDDDDFPVPFMLFDQLETDLEQQLFVAINREQKRVSMSHVLYVEGDSDELTSIAERLNEDDRSPWHRKVNLIGSTGTGLSLTLQGLRDGLELLFAAGRTKVLSEEQKYVIAREFWTAVAETWPDAWSLPKKHAITTAVGILGLSKSGSFLIVDCLTDAPDADEVIDKERLRALLRKARPVDWRRADGQFAGLGGRGGADRAADILDAYFFGGPIA